MKRGILKKYILRAVVFLLCLLFVLKFAKATILRLYVETGIGSCKKNPVFCQSPEEEIINPGINKEYLNGLIAYNLSEGINISAPKGLRVVKEKITKVYYKKNKRKTNGSAIYLLYKKPDFFVGLFPKLKKKGMVDDYEFLKYTMYAKLKDISNLEDAFFVIMKAIFIPDLGDQKNIKMVKFNGSDKKGFINYNLSPLENYFDCNIIDSQGNFFKIYIKDKEANLDLDKVFTIISTLNKS